VPFESSERLFYDHQYRDLLSADLRLPRFDGRVNSTLKEVLDFSYGLLGPLRGKRVLDFAGGDGWNAALLAYREADVVSFDLSPVAGQVTRKRAEANRMSERVQALACDGSLLPFADESFDLIHGCGVLHHLEDLGGASGEVYRVLVPGGRAVFIEPLGHNPILEFARRHIGYRGKRRSPGERPLRYPDLDPMRGVFPELRTHERKLLGMLDRVIDWEPFTRVLDVADKGLFRMIPSLRRWCRLVVVELPKSRKV
jgi:SAM-dependent methyltransferase